MSIQRSPHDRADDVLRRIERMPDGHLLLESDLGQALLAEAARMADEARRATARMSRRQLREEAAS